MLALSARVVAVEQVKRFSAFYFLLFAGLAVLSPYWPAYLAARGWRESEVGRLIAAQRLTAFVAGPAAGGVADRWLTPRAVLLGSLVAYAWLRLAVSVAEPHWSRLATGALVVGGQALSAGLVPLTDRATVHWLQRAGRAGDYGRVRLWGAVGWGVGALAAGAVDDYDRSFQIQLVWFTLTCLPVAALWLNLTRSSQADEPVVGDDDDDDDYGLDAAGAPDDDDDDDDVPDAIVNRPRSLGEMFRRPATVFFLVVVLAQGSLMGVVANNLFVFLQNTLGAPQILLGATLVATTLGELPFFFFDGRLHDKLGSDGILALAAFCLAIRLGNYALLPHYPTLWLLLPVETLHGVTYALMWSAAVKRAAAIAPIGRENTVQGLLGGLYFGAGAAVGAAVGGAAADAFGDVAVFSVASAVALGVCALCLLWMWQQRVRAGREKMRPEGF